MENVSRENILVKAVEDCFREMYAKAQPEADWDNLIEEYHSGKIGKNEAVYDRHYLSQAEFIYIVNKYMDAYRIKCEWPENIEILEEYLKKGGKKDIYISPKIDKDGTEYPGHRSYENVPPLKDHIKEIVKDIYGEDSSQTTDLVNKINDKVMELIDTCKNYYKFNVEENKFRFSTALGASPTSNKETVIKWWKDNYDVDIEIKERNPLLLWEYDEYGDEMDEIMTEEYGEDWEAYWWKEYEAEQAKKKAELEEKMKKYSNDINKEK